MDYAYQRHRGPPPFASSSSFERERERERDDSYYHRWEGDRSRDRDLRERLPLQTRRPSFDEERYYSRRPFPPSNGHSAAVNGGAGSTSTDNSIEGERFRGHPPNRWRTRERDNSYYNRERPEMDDMSDMRDFQRDRRVSGGPSSVPASAAGEGAGAGAGSRGGPSGWPKRDAYGQRYRSLSPPSTTPSTTTTSGPSLRHRFEQQSPHHPSANGRQGQLQSDRDWSTSSRGGSQHQRENGWQHQYHEGGSSGGSGGARRPPPLSAPLNLNGSIPSNSSERSRFESATTSKNGERKAGWHEEQQSHPDKRPFDNNGWSRQTAKSSSELNGWRDDKGKGPASNDHSGNRAAVQSIQKSPHQHNPPSATPSAFSSSNGSRARSPESIRSRGRRSPSLVDDIHQPHSQSPTSSTYSHNGSRNFPDRNNGPSTSSSSTAVLPNGTPASNPHNSQNHSRQATASSSSSTTNAVSFNRASIPPNPPLSRANSNAGQAAATATTSTSTFPPDRPLPSDALETRLSRSASASQSQSQSQAAAYASRTAPRSALVNSTGSNGSSNKPWLARRRSLSESPAQELHNSTSEKASPGFSSPRSLADRIGPLASTVAAAQHTGKDLQDRIQPLPPASTTTTIPSSRGWTPPPRSPASVRQSSAVQSAVQQPNRPRSPSSPRTNPVQRSYTPPPSLKRPLPSNFITTATSKGQGQGQEKEREREQHAESVSPVRTDTISKTDMSPSPKLASSPSDVAPSSPRPSTAETQIDDSMMEAADQEEQRQKDETALPQEDRLSPSKTEDKASTSMNTSPSIKFTYKASQKDSSASAREPLPRTPVPARQLESTTTLDAKSTSSEAQANDNSATTKDKDIAADETAMVIDDSSMGVKDTALENEGLPITSLSGDKGLEDMAASEDATMDIDSTRPSSRASGTPDVAAGTISTRTSSEIGDVEDEATKEFEKSLTSFIEVQEQDDSEDSIDVAALLEANRLRVPISLPLAVEMSDSAEDVYEIKPLSLQNHDLLDAFLQDEMAERDKRRGEKIFRLRMQYKELDNDWYAHCNRLEKMREKQKRRQNIPLNPPTLAVDAAGLSFTPATPSLLAPSGRSNRRSAATSIGYGDAVRSEAEFLEILASLEDADMRDPNLRAMRTTATVPDQIIDPSELTLQRYNDDNGKITDPFEHYAINKSPDNWTEDEIAIFCRRYALYPKQFGKIAAALPEKTTPQCVLFYYRSKKKIDFRALVDKRNRDGRRKRARAEQKGEDASAASQKKGPSLLGNLKRSKGDEVEDDEDDDPQTPGAFMLQESTVLSTAKALTRQINGGSVSGALNAVESIKGVSSRQAGSRTNSTKKAARFLSPPTRMGTEDSIAPASDGALAAAEALGFLSGVPIVDGAESGSRPNSAKQKKRKPSMTDSIVEVSFTEDGLPKSANGLKRNRPHSSSYWSVADKNEFVRLLSVHGKNYVAIAEGIVSKTAVQCKNFFQNNVKKLGLAEIADRIDGDFGNTSGEANADSPFGKEIPSVFGEPNAQAGAEPAPGYFISSHHAGGHDTEDNKAALRGGGMNLHDLLDNAPDAEGGAQRLLKHGLPAIVDGDSSTEDEAEPARYAQESMDLDRSSRLPPDAKHEHYRDRTIKEEMMAIDPNLQEESVRGASRYSHHVRSSSFGARASFSRRDQFSPSYPSVLRDERGYSLPPRQHSPPPTSGRYEGAPYSGQWSTYEGRTVFAERGGPTGQAHYPRSSRYEDGSPVPYYQRDSSNYVDSPVVDKTSALPYSARSVQAYYEHRIHSPHPPASALQHQSDTRNSDSESPYYEHYNRPRAG